MATYGEGDPTDNAQDFYDWLQETDVDLTGVKFAVSLYRILWAYAGLRQLSRTLGFSCANCPFCSSMVLQRSGFQQRAWCLLCWSRTQSISSHVAR